MRPTQYDGSMATHLLDPKVCFLNHGSFGSTPDELLLLQMQLRREMEREPVDFLARTHTERWHTAVSSVARFLNAEASGTVLIHNATSGINSVIASFPWAEGDEILTTNHRYPAVRNTFDHSAKRHGVRVVEANVPFPIDAPQQMIDAIAASITPKTRMIAIDQIASPTALIFPVKEIIAMAKSKGIATLIDGAHAPGQIDLDLTDLGPDFWVGNFHKWLCAPKGTAVLFVAEQWRKVVHPTCISHGYQEGLHAEFEWTGTLDPTAWFCAAEAIALHERQGGQAFRSAHHALVQQGRRVIANAINVSLPHPDDPRLYGSMATIPLPHPPNRIESLWNTIRTKHGIEVHMVPWDNRSWVRISGYSAYNSPEQYDQLADALVQELN